MGCFARVIFFVSHITKGSAVEHGGSNVEENNKSRRSPQSLTGKSFDLMGAGYAVAGAL